MRRPQGPGNRRGGGIRKRVNNILRSIGSRRRQMTELATWDWDEIIESGKYSIRGVTVTTTPEYWHDEMRTYFALRVLMDDIRKRGGFACVSKDRGPKHGMLHYHLIAVFLKGTSWAPEKREKSQDPETQGYVGSLWSQALNYHGCMRVEVQELFNEHETVKYLTKYIIDTANYTVDESDVECSVATLEQQELSTSENALFNAHNGNEIKVSSHNGRRWWYLVNKKVIPYGEKIAFELSGSDLKMVYRVRRVIKKLFLQRLVHRKKYALLAKSGFRSDNSQVDHTFREVFGEKGAKRIMDKCVRSKQIQYLRRGGFFGFEIFISPADLQLCMTAAGI